jgi:hypothetical protein
MRRARRLDRPSPLQLDSLTAGIDEKPYTLTKEGLSTPSFGPVMKPSTDIEMSP